jgi:Asp-tRNA(Asn)/Glu-tRNA(Gln) amidotransferase A subunit family amidase
MLPRAARRTIVATAAAVALTSVWQHPRPIAARSATVPYRLMETTILETQKALDAGTITSEELVRLYLERIEAFDQNGPTIRSVIRLNPNALADAQALDAERRTSGSRGPLHGIPVLLKDNYDTFDAMPTSAASLSLAASVAPDDGFLVRRLREAGAVFLGKTNMHEFAFGITTISSLGGQTLNPYDLTRNPGGSSGGTGAAIAANFAVVGMGSDTCGSIRIPSSHNSLFGLRVTQGLFSRDGIVPLALTQDVGGPLARTVEDLAIVLDATAGFDPADPVTAVSVVNTPSTYTHFLKAGRLRGAKFGVLTDALVTDPADQEVADVIRAAAARLVELGADVIDVSVPNYNTVSNTSVITMEFRTHLDQYLAATPGAPFQSLQQIFDSGLFHPSLTGTLTASLNPANNTTSDAYFARLAGRAIFRDALLEVMADNGLDALIYPTIRRKPTVVGTGQPGSNCRVSAQSGLPAISVPAGFTADGLPVGMEFLSEEFTEGKLLELAYSWEQATHIRRVPASTPDIEPAWAHQVTDGTATFSLDPATRRFRFTGPGMETFVTIDPAMHANSQLVLGATRDHRWHVRYSIGRSAKHGASVSVDDLWDEAGAYHLVVK